MYACVTGNSLGNVMANATLRVNEFHAMTLDTVDPSASHNSVFTWVVLSIIAFVLIIAVIMATCFYQWYACLYV